MLCFLAFITNSNILSSLFRWILCLLLSWCILYQVSIIIHQSLVLHIRIVALRVLLLPRPQIRTWNREACRQRACEMNEFTSTCVRGNLFEALYFSSQLTHTYPSWWTWLASPARSRRVWWSRTASLCRRSSSPLSRTEFSSPSPPRTPFVHLTIK